MDIIGQVAAAPGTLVCPSPRVWPPLAIPTLGPLACPMLGPPSLSYALSRNCPHLT